MTLEVGQRMPEGTLTTMAPDGPRPVPAGELFAGKRVVLFAVPGAFTPTCSDTHLPGFQARADDLAQRGVDTVACMAVNDVFVMDAWRRARGVGPSITMLADGNGDYARALGLELDASRWGMGTRSRRFAAIVEDGRLSWLAVEPGGEVGVSSADAVLAELSDGG